MAPAKYCPLFSTRRAQADPYSTDSCVPITQCAERASERPRRRGTSSRGTRGGFIVTRPSPRTVVCVFVWLLSLWLVSDTGKQSPRPSWALVSDPPLRLSWVASFLHATLSTSTSTVSKITSKQCTTNSELSSLTLFFLKCRTPMLALLLLLHQTLMFHLPPRTIIQWTEMMLPPVKTLR